MWHLLIYPLGDRVHARDPRSGFRVFHVSHAVPDHSADIHLVPENIGSAFAVRADRRIPPGAATRALDLLQIEASRDGDEAVAGSKHREDPGHHRVLINMDAPFAENSFAENSLAEFIHLPDELISIAEAASRFSPSDPPTQASMGLVSQVFQEQGIHRPPEPDAGLLNETLLVSMDRDSGEGKALVETGHIGLIPRQAAQGL